MKLALVVSLAITLAGRSNAEPLPEGRVGAIIDDDTKTGEAIRQRLASWFTAIKTRKTAKALSLLDAQVSVEALEFTNATCQRAFGGDKRVTVKGAQRSKLVACLAREKWFTSSPPFRVELEGGVWRGQVDFGDMGALTELELGFKTDGRYVIRGIVAPLGVEGGVLGGVAGGSLPPEPKVGGVVYIGFSPPPPPPPPPPGMPQNVPPTLLEGYRVAGDKAIVPDDDTKTEIQRAQRDKVIAALKLCIDETGAVTTVKLLKRSGFPAYDRKLEAGMRTWRYRPFVVNGKAIKVCTAVTFIYSQN